MKQNLQRKLDKYKISISQQSLDTAKVKKLGLTSAAAMAAMVTIPVELNSQVVCGNQGTPTRTIGTCIAGAGNLGEFYSNFCAKFDFDGDGINELQVRYYNYNGVYPKASAYIDPIGVNIHTVLLGDSYFGYPTFPLTPTLQTWDYSAQYRDKLYLVPLSTGSGYGFIAFDMDAWPWTNPDPHPNTGQNSCCYNMGLPSMWGGNSIMNINNLVINSAADPINCASALPVVLSAFEAKAKGNSITLEWTTESEVNNAGFAIERSMDGKEFREIAFVDGNDNSTKAVEYSYEDKTAIAGTQYYYRLRQIDFDGRTDISDVKSAMIQSDKTTVNVFPNPANATINIEVGQNAADEISYALYSPAGELAVSASVDGSTNQIRIDVTNLSNGLYYLKTTVGSTISYEKVMIQK